MVFAGTSSPVPGGGGVYRGVLDTAVLSVPGGGGVNDGVGVFNDIFAGLFRSTPFTTPEATPGAKEDSSRTLVSKFFFDSMFLI